MAPSRKIVIFPNFGLGDLIQATVLFDIAKKHISDAKIYCAVYSKVHQDLLENYDNLSGRIAFLDPHNFRFNIPYISSLISKNNKLFKFGTDFLFCMPKKSLGKLSNLLLWLNGGKVYEMDPGDLETSQVQLYQQEFCKLFNVQDDSAYLPTLSVSSNFTEVAQAKYSISKDYKHVLICYDTSEVIKAIPLITVNTIISFFKEKGYKVLLLRGTSNPEIPDILSGKYNQKCIVVEERDIRSVCGVMNHCDVIVAPDTGMGHIAGALGKPVISLFGPSELRFYPHGPRTGLIHKSSGCRFRNGPENCDTCLHPDAEETEAACMTWIKDTDLEFCLERILPSTINA